MTGPRLGRAGGIAVLMLLALGASAHATTVLKVGVEEMTRTSEWVVRARVLAVESVDLRTEGQGLYTDVRLAIDEVYRGQNVPTTHTLRLMGGSGKDGMALKIPGMPVFSVGEEVVLFLEKTGLGHVPCGLGQGVWRVLRPPLGPPVVRQSTAGLHLMTRGPTGAIAEAPESPTLTARTLLDLASEIRAVKIQAP